MSSLRFKPISELDDEAKRVAAQATVDYIGTYTHGAYTESGELALASEADKGGYYDGQRLALVYRLPVQKDAEADEWELSPKQIEDNGDGSFNVRTGVTL